MSQRGVERVIGRLATDEEFRRRFAEDPAALLREVAGCGLELTDLEIQALASVDLKCLDRLARTLDPRIQKIFVQGGRS